MRGTWFIRLFGIALVIFIVVVGFGQAVEHLWNWVMPLTFGLRPITYGQAVGLLLLSWLLFGGPRGWFPGTGHWRHRRWERWQQMTPEEREKFRQGMRGRCGHFGPPAAEPKP
jgi:hypothetical protein